MRFKLLLSVVLVLVLFSEGVAQSFYAINRDHDVIVSFGTGTSTYFGDLQNPGDNIDDQPSFNIGAQLFPVTHLIQNRIGVRAELTWFRLQGNDADADDDRVERNLSFYSNSWELNTVSMIHLFPQDLQFYKRTAFNLYGFMGIGLSYVNPKAEYQGDKVALQPLQTEGVQYSRFHFVVPYGLGLKFKTSPFLNIAIEGGWRKTFTDYLDDVSIKRYPDPAILQSDLSRALSDRRRERDPDYPVGPNVGVRGNPDKKDSYMLFNIKFEYYLPIDLNTDKRLMTVKRRKYYKRRR